MSRALLVAALALVCAAPAHAGLSSPVRHHDQPTSCIRSGAHMVCGFHGTKAALAINRKGVGRWVSVFGWVPHPRARVLREGDAATAGPFRVRVVGPALLIETPNGRAWNFEVGNVRRYG
jgi:hypothetical protein